MAIAGGMAVAGGMAISVAISVAIAVAIAAGMAGTVADPIPHLAAVNRHLGVGREAQPHAAALDFQDRDLEHDLQILRPTDHHALAILPR
jgi:hypothetical protein